MSLARFTEAQAGVYDQALAELRAGAKRSHWMWFVFPQIAGLGHSAMSQRYAIGSLDEARAYLAHPVLGTRLREVAQVVADRLNKVQGVLGTSTHIAFRTYSRHDLDAAFSLGIA